MTRIQLLNKVAACHESKGKRQTAVLFIIWARQAGTNDFKASMEDRTFYKLTNLIRKQQKKKSPNGK